MMDLIIEVRVSRHENGKVFWAHSLSDDCPMEKPLRCRLPIAPRPTPAGAAAEVPTVPAIGDLQAPRMPCAR